MNDVKITLAYGREFVFTNAQMDEWLDDLLDSSDEIMSQPLTVTNPFAFCAPEVIRGKITQELLKGKIAL